MSTRTSKLLGVVALCVTTVSFPSFSDTVVYQQGETYMYGTLNTSNPAQSTQVPNTSTLAFNGKTLNDMTNVTFCAYFAGGGVGNPAWALGKFTAVHRDGDGNADKILTQFSIYDNAGSGNQYTKAVIVELVNGNGGVMVCRLAARYMSGEHLGQCFFAMDADGSVTYNQRSGGAYYVYGLQVCPPHLGTSFELIWQGNDATLTLDDLRNAEITAHAGGSSISPRYEMIQTYNKCFTTNESGNVTSLIAEFQFVDDQYIKAVVVEFTNGVEGVCARAIAARFTSLSNGLGFRFRNEDGTYNGSSNSVATRADARGYGVYDLKAAVETEREWTLDADRNWSSFTGGEPIDDDGLVIRIRVTGESPTLTIDEQAVVAKIIFENALAVGTSTNHIALSGSGSLTYGTLAISDGAYVTVPSALSPASVTVGTGATAAYSGDATVSSAISGSGGVEVTGGRVTFTSSASTFGGGLTVKAGGVVIAGAMGEKMTGFTASGPLGTFGLKAAIGDVIVEDGAMVDLNGFNGLGYVFTLNGTGVATGGVLAPGPYANFGTALNIGTGAIIAGHSYPIQAHGFALAGNVALGAADIDLGIVTDNWDGNHMYGGSLNLGTNTLTKTGAGTLWLWTSALSVSGSGMLDITNGTVDVRKGTYNGSSSTLRVGENTTLRLDTDMKVRNLVNNGTIDLPGTVDAVVTGTYSGNGNVFKRGSAEVSMPFNNASKSVYVVSNGTLKAQSVTLANNNFYALNTAENPHTNQTVEVSSGAAFDFNGITDISASVRLASGATVANTSTNIASNNLQMVQLSLAGNATAQADGSFGLLAPGYRETQLELDGNTLTLTGTNSFWLCNATVLGAGTVVVSNGTLYAYRNASSGTDYGITVSTGGTFVASVNVAVKDFVNEGEMSGNGILTVTGTLTAGNAIPRLTLADGATVKMSGTNAVQSVTTSLSASGTITVDATAITKEDSQANANIPVLSAPSFPAGVTWELYDPYVENRRLELKTEGGTSTLLLHRTGGLIIAIH